MKLTSHAAECVRTYLAAPTTSGLLIKPRSRGRPTGVDARQNVSDGQLLFELNCARCHTEGWSVFDPTAPPTAVDGVGILGLSGGGGGTGGGTGFNLRDGGEIRRFGSDATTAASRCSSRLRHDRFGGEQGVRDRSASEPARCPGFGAMLTADQIDADRSYERYCLDAGQGNYQTVNPACVTGPSRAPADVNATQRP